MKAIRDCFGRRLATSILVLFVAGWVAAASAADHHDEDAHADGLAPHMRRTQIPTGMVTTRATAVGPVRCCSTSI